jgi:hypothetical protein
MDKKIRMKSEDIVNPDLTLASFHYEQEMDGKPLTIDGQVTGSRFTAAQKAGGNSKTMEKKLEGPVYPTSAINLYPVLHGLAIGANHGFTVFDPQTQSFTGVAQKIVAFEESPKLRLEPSFKMETRMHDHEVSTWINLRGETVFELGMGGILITYKETESEARRYLSEASLNKRDLILDFSLVKTASPLSCPRDAAFVEMTVDGIIGKLPLLKGPGQEATEILEGGRPLALYRITSRPGSQPMASETLLSPAERKLYLAATYHLESDHPEIRKASADITAGAASAREKIKRLTDWVAREVKDEAVESFSALEVLQTRKGECQAHAMLYTALARAAGIPTRITGGIVYMEGMGFLYHSWVESDAEGWISLDPTFNQVGADATHIKLVEGADWASILRLGKVVGQIKVNVRDYRAACVK